MNSNIKYTDRYISKYYIFIINEYLKTLDTKYNLNNNFLIIHSVSID